ncbi:hypothetical protein P692DRAFT_20925758, partial [Suillus brevipes Sb2]
AKVFYTPPYVERALEGELSHKYTKKVDYYIILCIYILNYYLYMKGDLLWCGGEAAVRWEGCGNN